VTRALVTQLVEALEKLSDTEQTYAALDKADAAIEAAREYLATEPSKRLYVGDSSFESWYSENSISNERKQAMREAYEAGMNDKLARPMTEPIGDRASLLRRANTSVTALDSRIMEPFYCALDQDASRVLSDCIDMLEADAQQRSKPHGHCTHIKCREIWVAYLGAIQKLSKYEPGATMHLNKEP